MFARTGTSDRNKTKEQHGWISWIDCLLKDVFAVSKCVSKFNNVIA